MMEYCFWLEFLGDRIWGDVERAGEVDFEHESLM